MDGATVLVPKDESQCVMISAFQYQELRLGNELKDDEINIVNAVRLGKKYVDKDTAQKVIGTPYKNLNSNKPFLSN